VLGQQPLQLKQVQLELGQQLELGHQLEQVPIAH
jgi:hypothetical protein